ncbi:MAG: hypothetical protein BWX88_03884 [Planctomycetes bacterium ADurb.Bin126]|nr:MAG: hypothetical protein BWX88_03884 [Planctomycetes bacterium ADurb.Bin126]HOD82616.1 toll/interleukin-1 receptor domain-containing protein [Phycisphaerae bacterium]HQL75039.1 toll/interleukin-1 receptor domain-containing protein [Phycisphaerae bacterium]
MATSSPFMSEILNAKNIWILLGCVTLTGLAVMALWARRKMQRWRSLPFHDRTDSSLFLSYKSDDAGLVRFIAEQMTAQGIDVWFNEYRILLSGWEGEFEDDLKAGVSRTRRAVFFTNAKWAQSAWCVNAEAGQLLSRLGKDDCLEVRIPPHPSPHEKVPALAMLPHISTDDPDRWTLLAQVFHALGCPDLQTSPRPCSPRPLRGRVNGIPYELDMAGWTAYGGAHVSMGDLVLPRLTQIDRGTRMSVNVIVGKRGSERQDVNDLDDRRVFQNLRGLARSYFQGNPLAGDCVGVHLVLQSGLSHGAFTYWGKFAWCRKYSIILAAKDGGADVEFHFTCSVYGPFSEFCRVAWHFDDLVASLRYGAWSTD